MEASQVTISGKTYDMNHLGKAKKTMLRRKIIIEYIQSKPAGEYIKMEEFQSACRFTTYANAWSFVGRMIRDGVIQQFEGEKKKSFYYSVNGAVRVSTPKKVLEQIPDPTATEEQALANFVKQLEIFKASGLEFTLTISNKKEK